MERTGDRQVGRDAFQVLKDASKKLELKVKSESQKAGKVEKPKREKWVNPDAILQKRAQREKVMKSNRQPILEEATAKMPKPKKDLTSFLDFNGGSWINLDHFPSASQSKLNFSPPELKHELKPVLPPAPCIQEPLKCHNRNIYSSPTRSPTISKSPSSPCSPPISKCRSPIPVKSSSLSPTISKSPNCSPTISKCRSPSLSPPISKCRSPTAPKSLSLSPKISKPPTCSPTISKCRSPTISRSPSLSPILSRSPTLSPVFSMPPNLPPPTFSKSPILSPVFSVPPSLPPPTMSKSPCRSPTIFKSPSRLPTLMTPKTPPHSPREELLPYDTPENFWCTQQYNTEQLYKEGRINVASPFTPLPRTRRIRRSSYDTCAQDTENIAEYSIDLF